MMSGGEVYRRELRELSDAVDGLSRVLESGDLGRQSDATIYSWLQTVSASMAFLVSRARPVFRRISLTDIPLDLVKQSVNFFGPVPGGGLSSRFFDLLDESDGFGDFVDREISGPASVSEFHSALDDKGHSSSFPVGACRGSHKPTGEELEAVGLLARLVLTREFDRFIECVCGLSDLVDGHVERHDLGGERVGDRSERVEGVLAAVRCGELSVKDIEVLIEAVHGVEEVLYLAAGHRWSSLVGDVGCQVKPDRRRGAL